MNTFQILTLLGVGSLLLGFYGYLYNMIKKIFRDNKALRLGVQAVLRAQMIADYNHYMEKGWAPIYAKQSFENCWVQYETLGENGVMKGIHDEFMGLPTMPPEEEDD